MYVETGLQAQKSPFNIKLKSYRSITLLLFTASLFLTLNIKR